MKTKVKKTTVKKSREKSHPLLEALERQKARVEAKKLINIETGEFLDIDADDEVLSNAYKVVDEKIKELKQIHADLQEAIKMRINGQETFAGYWKIQYRSSSINESEDYKLLSKEEKKIWNKNKKEFDSFKKTIFADILAEKPRVIVIMHPKFG